MFVVEYFRIGEHNPVATLTKLAPALCDDVANPVGLWSERQSDDIAVRHPENVDRSAVFALRIASGVYDDAESG
ncbi:hypothetical protein A5692_02905 [Mycobacterium sp. E342]|nr:hypothetical protein A5692_02905 [Mycobacterium sp. E342]